MGEIVVLFGEDAGRWWSMNVNEPDLAFHLILLRGNAPKNTHGATTSWRARSTYLAGKCSLLGTGEALPIYPELGKLWLNLILPRRKTRRRERLHLEMPARALYLPACLKASCCRNGSAIGSYTCIHV